MRDARKIAALAAVLVVLLGVFAGLKLHNAREEESSREKDEASEIRLVDLKDVQEFSYSDGSQEMHFEKKGKRWVFSDDPDTRLKKASVERIVSEITGLTALRKLEDPDALGDYGLDSPACTVKASDGKGNQCTLFVGDCVESGYYLTVGDKKEVYTVGNALMSALQYDRESFVKKKKE